MGRGLALDIHQTIKSMQSVDGTDLKGVMFGNGNEILIEAITYWLKMVPTRLVIQGCNNFC